MSAELPQTDQELLESLRSVVSIEAAALDALLRRIDGGYVQAVRMILACQGKVVVSGMGKSGHIARKIAATLSSTGTLAVFLQPSEAAHGDLGLVRAGDVVLILGKSGESEEIAVLLPALKRIGAQVIAITAEAKSALGQAADLCLQYDLEREACLFDLAPTASTTVSLAIGDALAVTLMKAKNFQPEDFALFHPGGRLGRRLSLRVKDLMIPLAKCPVLNPTDASVEKVIALLGSAGLGIVLFSSGAGKLDGIMTDGDLRRLLSQHGPKVFAIKISDVMTKSPLTVVGDMRAVQALEFMEKRERPLNVVPVRAAESQELLGVIRLHELVKMV